LPTKRRPNVNAGERQVPVAEENDYNRLCTARDVPVKGQAIRRAAVPPAVARAVEAGIPITAEDVRRAEAAHRGEIRERDLDLARWAGDGGAE
jgi:hypothetical protein